VPIDFCSIRQDFFHLDIGIDLQAAARRAIDIPGIQGAAEGATTGALAAAVGSMVTTLVFSGNVA